MAALFGRQTGALALAGGPFRDGVWQSVLAEIRIRDRGSTAPSIGHIGG
jgi:hypothetical protein